MSTRHGFCPWHRIAYDRSLDPICPQCTMQRVAPPPQLDYDGQKQQPVDPATGALLDAVSLKPVA